MAVVEAMACEKQIIVSDVKGLLEVVNNGEFAKIVPKQNSVELANAIELLFDKDLNKIMGIEARKHVLKNYSWKVNLEQMIEIYNNIIN